MPGGKKRNTAGLLAHRRESVEKTRVRLHQALDRFEHRQLINLPRDSPLTVRNLAAEAEVSKDTPLSRCRKGQSGEYRFPDIVARFRALQKKLRGAPTPKSPKDRKIQELREVIKDVKEKLLAACRVNNQLDAERYEDKRRIKELEGLVTKLRREGLKVIPFDKKGKKR